MTQPYSNPVQHDRAEAEADKAAREARAYARSRFVPPTDEEVAEELERRRLDKPASIRDVPPNVYFADNHSISQSMLKTFMDRRRLYEAYYVTRKASPPPATDPMRKGTATHTAILEPDRFDQLVITYPNEILASNGAVSTKEAKAFRDEHTAAGRVVLKNAEAAQVRAMAESVRSVCGEWLKLPSKKEQAAYWTDAVTGLPCRLRLDWLVERNTPVVFDLKTANDASPQAFRKACEDRGYWLQASHYVDGIKAATGAEDVLFYFIVVESDYPHACAIYSIDQASLREADMARCRLMIELAKCLESGNFAEPWERAIQPLVMRPWCFEPTLTGVTE